MPDISSLISRWWKQILFLVVISLVIAGVIVFFKPDQYLSVATAVAGNSLSSDKSRIFSQNIEGLYSDLGSPDELDVIVGTAQLDTIYLAVTDAFNLYDHYKIRNSDDGARLKSAKKLKKNSRIIKSDYGELKVKVWDTDRNLAPQLANALMTELEHIHRNIKNSNNKKVLESLQRVLSNNQNKIDSINFSQDKNTGTLKGSQEALLYQIEEYEKLSKQYRMIVDSNPPALIIVETARPALQPDKPKRLEILVATAVLSLLFAFFVSLLFDRRKK